MIVKDQPDMRLLRSAALMGLSLDQAVDMMRGEPGTPIDMALVEPRHWVADIVYFPLETTFLAQARAKGCHTIDGSGMAVFQAVAAFELFTGCTPDPARMRATFDSFT